MNSNFNSLNTKTLVFNEECIEKDDHRQTCESGTGKCKPKKDYLKRYEHLSMVWGKNALPYETLEELYMRFIGDEMEWENFVETSHLVKKAIDLEIPQFDENRKPSTCSKNDPQRFTDAESRSLIAVLNESVDKLRVLGANKPNVKPQLHFQPLKVRFQKTIRKCLFDEDVNILVSEAVETRQLYHYQRLRGLLENVLCATIDEIHDSATYTLLMNFLVLEEERLTEENSLNKNFEQITKLNKRLEQIKTKNDVDTLKVIENYEKVKKELKEDFQHEMFRYGEYLSYFKSWAEAEFESEKWEKDEHYIKWIERELKKCELACNTENRVHRDVTMFLKLSMKKLEKDVKRWSNKYDKDMNEKESEISEVKQKRKGVHEQMSEMLSTFKKRQYEIQSYLKKRGERERKAAEEKRVNDAATKIQAWWRGVMVRWEFGKYEDKSKRKKPKTKTMKGRR